MGAASGEEGALLFSSDGHDGSGGPDLFLAMPVKDGRSAPSPLTGLNTSTDDFDAAFAGGWRIVFSRGDVDKGPVKLYVADKQDSAWSAPRLLPPEINCSAEINNGPSVSPAAPGRFFWSAARPEAGRGRMDIFEAAAALLRAESRPWPLP